MLEVPERRRGDKIAFLSDAVSIVTRSICYCVILYYPIKEKKEEQPKETQQFSH